MSKRLASTLISSLKFCTNVDPRVLKLGDTLKLSRAFTNADVLDYSNVSCDLNPVHFDADCGRKAGFDGPLVHGMLVASMFPRIISTHFPGAVYISQSLQFKQPVYIGEEVAVEVQAISMRDFRKKYLVKFSTKCLKQDNLLALDGEATAILPSLHLDFRIA